jgi:hypothetical protein
MASPAAIVSATSSVLTPSRVRAGY